MVRIIKRIISCVLISAFSVSVITGCTARPVTDVISQSPQTLPNEVNVEHPWPLIYESGGSIFIASGTKNVCLGKTSDLYNYEKCLNCEFAENGNTLYYISYNGNESAGSLMKVGTDASSAPQKIAENVCAVRLSRDGEKVLYVTSTGAISGTLYLYDGNAEPVEIAEDVIPHNFGFSREGKCIHYLVQGDEDITLYSKNGGNEPALVTTVNGSVYIDRGTISDCFWLIIPYDSGMVLYEAMRGGRQSLNIYYPDGKTEMLCECGSIVMLFDNEGEFLYSDSDKDSGSLWYKAPGQDPVKMSGNYLGNLSADNNRDLIIFERGDNSSINIYEQEIGGQKTFIDQVMTFDYGIINLRYYSGGFVTYNKGMVTYIARKTANGWVAKMLSENPCFCVCIDSSGKNLYYIDANNGDGQPGSLFRYSLETEEMVKFMDNVSMVNIIGDELYALKPDGGIYRIEGDNPVKLADNIADFWQGDGGVNLITRKGDMLFIANGSYIVQSSSDTIQNLNKDETNGNNVVITDWITYYPPLDKDEGKATDFLMNDAQYYLSQLDAKKYKTTNTPKLTLERDISLSEAFMNSIDECGHSYAFFPLLNDIFKNYSLWLKTKDENYKNEAISSFEAINEYEERLQEEMAQNGE